jgi:hypothetical protein
MRADSAELKISSFRILGLAERISARYWKMRGQDGGFSIIWENKIIWVFHDTLIDLIDEPEPVPGPEEAVFLANCAALSGGEDLKEDLAGLRYYSDERERPREILPATPEEERKQLRFWPQHGFQLGEKVYLYYVGIRRTGRGTWDFETVGSGLAVLDPNDGSTERVQRDGDWCLWRLPNRGVQFGVQTLVRDDVVYVFGTVQDGYRSSTRLARVDVQGVADPEKYEYLASPEPEWSSSLAESHDLGSHGSGLSVSYNRHLGCYLMTYADPHRKELYLRAAENVWGPYSRPSLVGSLPHEKESELIGPGLEHPAYAKDDGRTVFITYSQPNFNQNTLVAVEFG